MRAWQYHLRTCAHCANILRMDGHDDDLLTIEQVAELLGLAKRTLINWRSAGRGPTAFRLGRALRYRRSAVDAWVAEQEALDAARV